MQHAPVAASGRRKAGPDVFAHFSAIDVDGFKTLKEGARVDHDASEGLKGLLAMHIRAAGAAQETAAAPAPATLDGEAPLA